MNSRDGVEIGVAEQANRADGSSGLVLLDRGNDRSGLFRLREAPSSF